jgi:hypothetical protein
MMGRWGIRETLMCIAAVLLLCSICYYVGKLQERQDKEDSALKTKIAQSDSTTRRITTQLDTAQKHSDILTTYRSHVRAKITVAQDTVKVAGTDSVITVSPAIAQLVQADDSTIAAQARTIALQSVLIASLREGIALRDERIHLLEQKGAPRLSKGFQVGGGYCLSATGQVPCVYAGYGAEVRLP